MKISVIDVGSNSVRLATFAGGKTLYKKLNTTRLGEGLAITGRLKNQAIERTAVAVDGFVREAVQDGAEKVFVFATAAIRSSENGRDFIRRVKELCGIEVDVLSGEEEAGCGILGALGHSDGGIIDVGGASTEVTVRLGGKIVYAKSVDIGTVRLYDLAGRDRQKLLQVIEDKLKNYGGIKLPAFNAFAIGGTASRLASVKHGLREFKPEVTHGTVITLEELYALAERLLTLSVEEIRATTVCGATSDMVGGGGLLLAEVANKFGLSKITVSEKDNLEGYLLLKEGKL